MNYHEYMFIVLLVLTLTAMLTPTYGQTILFVNCGLLLAAIRTENTRIG